MSVFHILSTGIRFGGCRIGVYLTQIPAAGSCAVAAICKYTRTTEILWRKRGCVAALQVKERAPDPRLDRLLLFFSGHIISRVILIYHAQVHHR